MRGSSGMQRGAGYGLIETLVVVALIGIVLAMSLPSFVGLAGTLRLRSVADQLRSDMSEARTAALERHRFVYLSFVRTSALDWCWGLSLQTGCDCRLDNPDEANYCALDRAEGGEPLPRRTRSSQFRQIRLDAPPFGGELRFSPVRPELIAGNASFSGGDGRSVRVVASSLGRLRLCAPASAPTAGLPPC